MGEDRNEFAEDLKYADKIAALLKVNLRRAIITSRTTPKILRTCLSTG